VELPAVELDDEVRTGPMSVDLEAGDEDVDSGEREVLLGAEAKEARLEPGLGPGEIRGRAAEEVT